MILRLSAADLVVCADELAAVLVDAVAGGASVGFLDPLAPEEAAAWWRALVPEVADGSLVVWVARTGGVVSGTVQVRLSGAANGAHRAEVAKLMVHRAYRGRKLGRMLLETAETWAAETGVSLLLVDAQTGSAAEGLYRSAGWKQVGTVPEYAADPSGELRPTTFFYKLVSGHS